MNVAYLKVTCWLRFHLFKKKKYLLFFGARLLMSFHMHHSLANIKRERLREWASRVCLFLFVFWATGLVPYANCILYMHMSCDPSPVHATGPAFWAAALSRAIRLGRWKDICIYIYYAKGRPPPGKLPVLQMASPPLVLNNLERQKKESQVSADAFLNSLQIKPINSSEKEICDRPVTIWSWWKQLIIRHWGFDIRVLWIILQGIGSFSFRGFCWKHQKTVSSTHTQGLIVLLPRPNKERQTVYW